MEASTRSRLKKKKSKSFITLTFTRTEPLENKTLSLIDLCGPVKGWRQKVNVASSKGGLGKSLLSHLGGAQNTKVKIQTAES